MVRVRTIEGAFDEPISMQCQFTPDGKHIITGNGEMTTKVWETDSGKLVRKLDGCLRAYAADANIVSMSRTRIDGVILKGVVLVDPLKDVELLNLSDENFNSQGRMIPSRSVFKPSSSRRL